MQIESPLYSEHIFLRTMQPADATLEYLGWLSDAQITSHLEVRFSPPKSTVDLESFISTANASPDTLLLGIFSSSESRHIGNIKLGSIDWHHQVGDIGFLIGDVKHWGKGHASTAIGLLANYAFAHLKLAKLTAGCYSLNEGSRRALLKAGFTQEGRLALKWLVDGKRQDGLLFGRINPVIAAQQ